MKSRALLLIAATLGVVAVSIAYAASPLFAVGALKAAARSGDRDRLDQVVDVPAIRENLRAEIVATLVK